MFLYYKGKQGLKLATWLLIEEHVVNFLKFFLHVLLVIILVSFLEGKLTRR